MSRSHQALASQLLGQQRIRWLDSVIESMDAKLSKLWEIVENKGASCAAVRGVTRSWTRLSDRTTQLLSPRA